MVEIKEYTPLIYNLDKLEKFSLSLKDTVCPPFDTISSSLHRVLLKKKYNFVNLELPKGKTTKKYEDAKKILSLWKKNKIVIKENLPCFYIYEHKFYYPDNSGKSFTRLGVFCLVRIDKDYKNILPHEYTNPKPLEDRKKLLSTVNIQTSAPFFLVDDPNKELYETLKLSLKQQYLWTYFKDEKSSEHKIYKVVATTNIAKKMKEIVKQKKFFIADGHHRYKVTSEYLSSIGQEYLMGYICSIEDEGVLILPTHRVVIGKHIIEEIKKYFELIEWDGRSDVDTVIYYNGTFNVLRPKIKLVNLPKVVSKQPYFILDKVLTELEGEQIRQQIFYTHDLKEAVYYADRYNSCAFIMNSVKKNEFIDIIKNGYKFPPKSTYFYPKVISGINFYEI
ncbi:MAG: DUF1015 domain-containing protein [Endomicrobia bacterium]|nr:DUF1015 domain-containing protein [Endomicrobiia bacterium]